MDNLQNQKNKITESIQNIRKNILKQNIEILKHKEELQEVNHKMKKIAKDEQDHIKRKKEKKQKEKSFYGL